MKKILAAVLITVVMTASAHAGNIATIMGTDIIIGAAAGAALGTAIATPFFIAGGSKDGALYLTGAGWGFVCGAGAGLLYGIWNVIYFVNERNAQPEKKKTFLGVEDLYLASDGTGFTLTKKF